MITVLSVIDTGGPGGAETVYLNTCAGLDPERVRSVCVVSRDGWLTESLRARGLQPLVVPSSGSLNVSYLRELMRIAKDVRADVLVGHLYGSSIYCGLAGLLLGIPVISVLHGQSDIGGAGRFGGLKKWIVRNASHRTVFVSERLLDELRPILGLRPAQCVVIPNGVDLGRFGRSNGKPLRAELGLEPEHILVGAVGNIRKPKSYDVFLRAARLLKDRSPRYRFAIAGEGSGPLFDSLLNLRRELGLESEVTFLGLRKDVPALMQSFDIYALSSTTEGFSIACIEAMAAGTPVVATRSGGPQEILEEGRSGMLVPVQDPPALADAIHRLAFDSDFAAGLTRSAQARVRDRYTIETMLAAYAKLFSEAVSSRA